MNAKCKCRMVTAELAIAAVLLDACATGNGSIAQPAAATAVPVEYLTQDVAAEHAADPKSPTGALIIKSPINVMLSDPPSPDPRQ
jgi:hypothetical protein